MTDPDLHTRELAAAADDPTAWFEQLYAEAGAGRAEVPWDRAQASAALVEWADPRDLTGVRTLVVGCGYGRDAEFLAPRGAGVVAFDIAPSAIEQARRRHPDTTVEYVAADLLSPPPAWLAAFALVVEDMNVQALPEPVRTAAIEAVGRFVAPGGTLLVVEAVQPDDVDLEPGPPWPLRRREIDAFGTRGLRAVAVEQLDAAGGFAGRWRAEFRRDPA